MQATPRVSVITIFLNACDFLPEAVESVRAQTYCDWELILVDDGSSDKSTQIAKNYAESHSNISYADHPGHVNRGMSASRNLGISMARGELIAFIDSDDIWLPEKLAEQVNIMAAEPSVVLVAGAICSVPADYGRSGTAADVLVEQVGSTQDKVIAPPAALKQIAPLGPFNAPIPSDILVRKSAIEEVGGFEDEFRGAGEDAVFFTKIFTHYSAYFSSKIWTRYRQHSNSSISQAAAEKDRGRAELDRVFAWISGYVSSGSSRRDDVLRLVAWRTFRRRHPSFNLLVEATKIVIHHSARRRLRAIWRQIEMFSFRYGGRT